MADRMYTIAPSPLGHHRSNSGEWASPGGRRLKQLANVVNRRSFRSKVPENRSVTAVEWLAKQSSLEGGQSLNDLTFVRRLGEGAFATVDLYTMDANPVALKRMKQKIRGQPKNPMVPDDCPLVDPPPNWHAMFQAEIVMCSTLRHANVVACYGVLKDEESAYLQEFCDGGTLLDKLRKPSSYTLLDALLWVLDVAKGMEYLHRPRAGLRIAHRDLKPENVLLSSADGKAKVADFGLSRLLDPVAAEQALEKAAPTTPGGRASPPAMATPRTQYNVEGAGIHGTPPPPLIVHNSTGSAEDVVQLQQPPSPTFGRSRAVQPNIRPPRLAPLKTPPLPRLAPLTPRPGDRTPGRSGGGPRSMSPLRWRKPLGTIGSPQIFADSPHADMTGQTGSCRYMAPEVWANSPGYTHKVDVFSFGILCFEMVAKKSAYAERYLTSEQIAKAVHDSERVRPNVPTHWPQAVVSLLGRCWAGEPDDRPEFEEVVMELEALVEQAQSTPPGAPNPLLDSLAPQRSKPAQLLARAFRSSRSAFRSSRQPSSFLSSLSSSLSSPEKDEENAGQ